MDRHRFGLRRAYPLAGHRRDLKPNQRCDQQRGPMADARLVEPVDRPDLDSRAASHLGDGARLARPERPGAGWYSELVNPSDVGRLGADHAADAGLRAGGTFPARQVFPACQLIQHTRLNSSN